MSNLLLLLHQLLNHMLWYQLHWMSNLSASYMYPIHQRIDVVFASVNLVCILAIQFCKTNLEPRLTVLEYLLSFVVIVLVLAIWILALFQCIHLSTIVNVLINLVASDVIYFQETINFSGWNLGAWGRTWLLNSVSLSVSWFTSSILTAYSNSLRAVKVWPFLATFTWTNAFMVSYVIPKFFCISWMTSSTERWVPLSIVMTIQ